jgi:Tetratricopeptide repeat
VWLRATAGPGTAAAGTGRGRGRDRRNPKGARRDHAAAQARWTPPRPRRDHARRRRARASAWTLSRARRDCGAPAERHPRRIAAHRRGATTLAEGDAANALPTLRHALEAWRELPAPYDVARVRLLIGSACRILGDEDTATLELKAAREVFAELGAASALAAINSIAGRTADVDLLGSRRGRRRCCAWSPQAGATARSPPSW